MDRVKKIYKSQFFQYGLPFMITIIGGSFFLQHFTRLRYQFSKKSAITRADFEKEGIRLREPGEITIEAEYERMKAANLDDWEQKRIPRPWDEEENL